MQKNNLVLSDPALLFNMIYKLLSRLIKNISKGIAPLLSKLINTLYVFSVLN